ncbi:hypothetical protein [Mesorhizobium sp. 1M-11]|uniref:hypothetical protein n=1 Tax=Mesorhizobium sp. 1M-11 TaxID=1529006 RepID=UPI0006C751DD|nr:hypothetical protein [Mesorhizobium sp. 1M-11]
MKPLASLFISLVAGEAGTIVKHIRGAAIACGLALIAALMGVSFLLLAAYLWAADRFGPINAALGFGAGFLVLAGVVFLAYRLSAKRRARRRAERRKNDLTAFAIAAGIAALPELLRSKEGLATLLGPLAALLAYAAYRENFPSESKPDDTDESTGDPSQGGSGQS